MVVVHATIVSLNRHNRSCTVHVVGAEGVTGPGERADAWFASHTSSIDDWPIERLLDAKAGQHVGVVLPARDEEATVGDIVVAIRAELLDRGLVDDIVVVDSASHDATAEVAAASGARVVGLTDVLPDVPPRPGKGEALWRGVAATSGDLVVFVDADLQSFDPRFVVALLGPLLCQPSIRLVKAAYDRPAADPAVPSYGGGRVTELMARPWISAFWPDLAGVLQPLAGEYAARRDLLTALPFRCGFGVDLGLLLDTYRLAGLDAIAQVDLRRRWHRHSDLPALGRMAAEVMHTALDRLVAEGRLPTDLDAATVLWQPDRTEGGVRTSRHDVDTSERPPLRDVLPAPPGQKDQSATK
jgi:glucosyl-3-phosphoglycerate synthase